MTVQQLIAWHELGAIIEHELVVSCLNLVEPGDHSAVLDQLPTRTLTWLRDFLDQYRPGEMVSLHGGAIPTPDQVLAARRWLASEAPSVSPTRPAPASPTAARATP